MTMTTAPDEAEPLRDAHLLAALRHAPGRDAAPAAALSARILERARAAAATTARPEARWHAAWRRALLLWHEPRRAAAFATLAIALLLGLLWGSQEPPVALPAAAPEPAAALRDPGGTAPADAAPPPAAPPAERAPAGASTDNSRQAARPRPAPSPRSEPAPAPAPPAAVPPLPAEPARGEAAADSAAPRSAEPTTTNGQAADAALEQRRDEPAALGRRAAAPSRRPAFAQLDALVAGDGATLSWQRGTNTWAHGAAQRRWWTLLRGATRGAWVPEPATAPVPAAPGLTLLESGRPALTLWHSDGLLRLRDADGALWRAAPDEAQLQALRQASAGW